MFYGSCTLQCERNEINDNFALLLTQFYDNDYLSLERNFNQRN